MTIAVLMLVKWATMTQQFKKGDLQAEADYRRSRNAYLEMKASVEKLKADEARRKKELEEFNKKIDELFKKK